MVVCRVTRVGLAALGAASLGAVAAASASPPAPTPLARLVGQTVMSAMVGTTPSASLLGRVRRGEVGGIILFGANVVTRPQVKALVSKLQQAAKAGGNPPLLIATDQEGGAVRRFHSCPPFQSAATMGQTRTAAGVRAIGRATASCLRTLGVDVDLAPVLDVPNSASNFLGDRAFSRSVARVAALGPAFAAGVQQRRVAATGKHFPGLGTAAANTDTSAVVIRTSAAELMRRLAPYPVAIRAGLRLVMVSNASYPALDPGNLPAALSPTIVTGLLRGRLGFGGVVITDTLEAPGPAHFADAPVRALEAGVDVLLFTDETSSAAGFRQLLRAAQNGKLPRSTLTKADARVATLKAWLGR